MFESHVNHVCAAANENKIRKLVKPLSKQIKKNAHCEVTCSFHRTPQNVVIHTIPHLSHTGNEILEAQLAFLVTLKAGCHRT